MGKDNAESIEDELQRLECALHKHENRCDRAFMEKILHQDFLEIGRSGRIYQRAEIIEEFQSVSELPEINASNFSVQLLAKDVFLLTYLSSHLGDNAFQSRQTLRTSIWVATGPVLQLRFHQGTALDQ